MRILLLHNKYQYAGGEDKVFEAEAELLAGYHHQVERLVFDNKEISTTYDKLMSGVMSLYNFRSAKILDRMIKAFKPDILHVHNFVPLASPAVFFVAKRNKIPVVLTLHNYRLICPSATLFYKGKIYERSLTRIFPIDAILKGVYRNSTVQTAALALTTSFHNILGTWRNKVGRFIVLTEFAKVKFLESRLNVSPQQFMLKPNFITDQEMETKRERIFFYLWVGCQRRKEFGCC
jgi:glycosyltransferase involved in cell wall biosynthesis